MCIIIIFLTIFKINKIRVYDMCLLFLLRISIKIYVYQIFFSASFHTKRMSSVSGYASQLRRASRSRDNFRLNWLLLRMRTHWIVSRRQKGTLAVWHSWNLAYGYSEKHASQRHTTSWHNRTIFNSPVVSRSFSILFHRLRLALVTRTAFFILCFHFITLTIFQSFFLLKWTFVENRTLSSVHNTS